MEKQPFRDALLDLLFPPKCPFCRSFLEKGELFCPDCRKRLPWLTGKGGERKVEFTQSCVSALRYEGAVREAIHRYKFSGVRAYSRAFGTLVAQTVKDHDLTADLVSWPSISKKRFRERGYDQGELLAGEVSKALGLPALRTVDKLHRPAQSGIEGAAERRANLLGAYTAVKPEHFKGKTVLLVDDVVTSGATLAECSRTLRTAGAEAVICATLAQAGR